MQPAVCEAPQFLELKVYEKEDKLKYEHAMLTFVPDKNLDSLFMCEKNFFVTRRCFYNPYNIAIFIIRIYKGKI